MKVEVLATHQEANGLDFRDKTAVVIDTLRATSTIVTALAHGCRQVIPVCTPREAKILASAWLPEEVVLGGEQLCRPIEGFDLGNSPLEYMSASVAEKTVFLVSTNGTVALDKAAGAKRTLISSLLNSSATARALTEKEEDQVVFCCAGTRGKFALEDVITVGSILYRLKEWGTPLQLDELATAAYELYKHHREELMSLVGPHFNGRLGCSSLEQQELSFCIREDVFPILPQLAAGRVRLVVSEP